jgi:hypothetical protein
VPGVVSVNWTARFGLLLSDGTFTENVVTAACTGMIVHMKIANTMSDNGSRFILLIFFAYISNEIINVVILFNPGVITILSD